MFIGLFLKNKNDKNKKCQNKNKMAKKQHIEIPKILYLHIHLKKYSIGSVKKTTHSPTQTQPALQLYRCSSYYF